jgi:MFS family permease
MLFLGRMLVPVITGPDLAPAFNNVTPALTGALAAPYFMKNKKIYLINIIFVSILFGASAFCRTLPQFYTLAVVRGIFATGATMLPVLILITNWFQKKRALAISIAMAGSVIGGSLLSPVIWGWIEGAGWQKAYIYLGIMMLAVLVPLTLFVVKSRSSDRGLKPYGAEDGAEKTDKNSLPGQGMGEWNPLLSELRRLPVFWIFIAGALCVAFVGAILSHIPSALMDAGYSPVFAASVASLYLAIAIPGKLVLGDVFDRKGARAGILVGNIAFILTPVTLLFITHKPMVYVMALVFGLGTCIGTVTNSILTSKLFGAEHYAENYGFVSMFTNAGYMLGAIELSYDVTESYNMAWILLALLGVLMTAALLYAADYSRRRNEDAATGIPAPAADGQAV